jgi:DNA-binding NarL/FixJ family response regulator
MSSDLLTQILKDSDLSSRIREVVVGYLTQVKEEKSFPVYIVIIGKEQNSPRATEEDKKREIMKKYKLKESDIESIRLCAEGWTNKEIAKKLKTRITVNGVIKRLKAIREKIGGSNKAELVSIAKEEGII